MSRTDDSEERPYFAEHVRCDAVVGEVQHRELVLRAGVLEVDLEEEAVELGLGKLEDARVLVWVLGRDHEERIGKLVHLAVDRDLALLHRLEQGGLGARRGAVDLVGEEDVREDGAGKEDLLSRLDHVHAVELGRGRVGRELDALELRPEHMRDGAADQRLRAARRPLEEDVAVRECGDEQELDGTVLADDDLRDLGLRTLAQTCEIVVALLHHQCHCSSFRRIAFSVRSQPDVNPALSILGGGRPVALSAAILET